MLKLNVFAKKFGVFKINCYLCKEFTNFAVGKTKYAEFVDTKMYVYKA